MDRDYTYDLPATDVVAVAHLVFTYRRLLMQQKVTGFETTEATLGGDPRRKLVVCTDESWEKDSDCLLIEWTRDPASSDSVRAQVGRNTVILPNSDGTFVLKGDNLTFSLKASDTPEGKRLLDLIVQSAREGVTDVLTDMRETVEAHDIEAGCDFGDTVLEYDTAEILTPLDRAFLIATLVRAIQFGLKAGQRRDDGFIYYQTIQETVFGRQILQMRVGSAQRAGVAPAEGEQWIALSCRSGAGDAFTAAFPHDLYLDTQTEQIMQNSAANIPMVLLENDFTAERYHRLIHLLITESRQRQQELWNAARSSASGEALRPRGMAETLQQIVQESRLTREQRRRLDQRNKQKRKQR